VTAAHVAEAMRLSQENWKELEVRQSERKHPVHARVLHLAGSHSEKIAVLELKEAFSDAVVLSNRMEPLVAEEPLVSLGYPNDALRFAGGRFVRVGDGKLTGLALLELYDGQDRLVLDHGASGAPVLDCGGKVVAVVSALLTQTLNFPPRVVRVSTAWQSPNVASVPIEVLKDLPAIK
jgi:hypothetical protein